jgi:cytosine/adenosine deaminase-related metal-dependent hydrolase
MEHADYLIEGTVVTADSERRVITDGAVAVRGERIIEVGKANAVRSRLQADRTLGGHRDLVIPGLIDCHNHLAQALVREHALEDLPNVGRVYIPAEFVMDEHDAKVSACVAIAQLLRAGVTTVAETTGTRSHERPIAEAVIETGIRCAMARGQGDRRSHLATSWEQISERSWNDDDKGKLEEDIAATEGFITYWQERGEGRLRPWAHGLGLPVSSDERMLRLRELTEHYSTGVMHHINRDREEVELSVALYGERPIEHLFRIGAIGPSFVAIHAMLTTYREIAHLAQAGAKVAHAPAVCTDIVSAVTKVPAMRAAGLTVGLGCDTVINDILAVMRIAFFLHQADSAVSLYDPLAFTTEDAFEMGTIEAAKTLLWEDEIGSLEPGKAADIVVLNGHNLRLSPAFNPVGVLVRYALSTDVTHVLIGGKLLVKDGQLLTIDEEALLEEATALGGKLSHELTPRRYRSLSQRAVVQ